ncbi:hypothetical protein EFL99_11440 [Lactococcus lactis]|uniref:hypothetical protein n=1 Tax=Lactococcus lactis TaxID=1358 RepID=UPI00223C0823|nr:hypothetical protein [Lactococcus lactis]MCT1183830.1 hypothetical protein [Lactococcus lactis]
MLLTKFDEEIFQKYVLVSCDKFYFTFLSKIPSLEVAICDYAEAFKIFYLHGGRYNISFYVEFINFLYGCGNTQSIVEEVMRYAAKTILFNHNTLYLQLENDIVGYTRVEGKILKIKSQSIEEFIYKFNSVKEYRCNNERL